MQGQVSRLLRVHDGFRIHSCRCLHVTSQFHIRGDQTVSSRCLFRADGTKLKPLPNSPTDSHHASAHTQDDEFSILTAARAMCVAIQHNIVSSLAQLVERDTSIHRPFIRPGYVEVSRSSRLGGIKCRVASSLFLAPGIIMAVGDVDSVSAHRYGRTAGRGDGGRRSSQRRWVCPGTATWYVGGDQL
ncbi:hypothetical protein CC85DRAFT_30389 [Cutaneotrichosporon oleaginosum]|uniref:Uncharacterized protein n=1 Tax=Cutaneotrichosporon oleaginosum TaxID=879819 RepID=A0A0J0XSM0_9TREE|nr:uncharacterized protein CC85DRAFT_30389 [Cutaneotrichosporon oleaginosum]KLT44096.1 hypothetical protein CC85DRAFT_30389 [Cutaneotrichosporon oleaginosum]TXT09449.1 hypothetical protein COLE_03383 [Cutaneotrichosporon oleaginosum]